jgi:hypothetical protein
MLACRHDAPVIVNDLVTDAVVTPGMLVETFDDSGEQKWRKNSSATDVVEVAVALNASYYNKGVDDAYAAGDLLDVWKPGVGDVFWGILPSGQDIAAGEYLQSNGDGKLKVATSSAASTNVAQFKALSSPGAVTVDTRVKAERIY